MKNTLKKNLMKPGNVLFLQIIGGFFVIFTFFTFFGLDTAGPVGGFIISLIIEALLIIWGFVLFILVMKKGIINTGKTDYMIAYILLATFVLPLIPLFLVLIHY